MARRRGQRRGHLFEDAGMWRLRYRENTPGDRNQTQRTIGPARGPGKLTEKQAARVAWEMVLSKLAAIIEERKHLRFIRQWLWCVLTSIQEMRPADTERAGE